MKRIAITHALLAPVDPGTAPDFGPPLRVRPTAASVDVTPPRRRCPACKKSRND